MTEGEPELRLRDPWLIAAWPGMGRVAMIAAQHLIDKLEGRKVASIESGEHFEINTVTIENGVVQRPDAPKNLLYAITAPPEAEHDLLVFMGDPQPSYKGYDFCRDLVQAGVARGVRRVVTFAAMATPVPPTAPARVFGVASEPALLPVLSRHEVGVLSAGQISGLNGVLLAAASERSVEGLCLLGELPGFAYAVPNPKAALAVLRAFERISGLDLELTALEQEAVKLEHLLGKLLEKMQQNMQQGGEEAEGGEKSLEAALAASAAENEAEKEKEKAGAEKTEVPSKETLARVEELFRKARADRSQAMQLKSELDRLGLFRKYEDRFLDLFRKPSSGEQPSAG
jgi:proteasome assembly chaperone (PAC2) family protein